MSKIISILGSTGSIGRQTLDVAEQLDLTVAALTANSSAERMEEQARRFRPRLAVLTDEAAAIPRETVRVDLPTPPFPEVTAMTFALLPAIPGLLSIPAADGHKMPIQSPYKHILPHSGANFQRNFTDFHNLYKFPCFFGDLALSF